MKTKKYLNLLSYLFAFCLLIEANAGPILSSVNDIGNLSDTESSAVQRLIKERVDDNYNVGLVVAVIDSKGSHFFSYGKTSKLTNSSLVNEKTIFPIASVTKVFTTLLLATDVINGHVKLIDPAQKYLPDDLKLPRTYRSTNNLSTSSHIYFRITWAGHH